MRQCACNISHYECNTLEGQIYFVLLTCATSAGRLSLYNINILGFL